MHPKKPVEPSLFTTLCLLFLAVPGTRAGMTELQPLVDTTAWPDAPFWGMDIADFLYSTGNGTGHRRPGDGWVSVPGHDDVTFELMPCRFVDVEPDGDTDGGDRREKQPTTKANQTFAFTRS